MKKGAFKTNNKGSANIEFLLSFILFIGVVVAVLYFYSPTRSVNYMQSSLSYTYGEIIKNTSIELKEYSINIEDYAMTNSITNIGLDLSGTSGKNVRAESYKGEVLSAGKDINSIQTCFDRGSSDFVILKFSEDYSSGGLSGCTACTQCYKVSSSNVRNVISEKRLIALRDAYKDNYGDLKRKMNIPSNTEFSFTVDLLGEKIEAARQSVGKVEIYSQSKLLEVLKADGGIEFAYLNVKIW